MLPADAGVGPSISFLQPVRLNILILHGLKSFANVFRSSLDYIECFQRYAPQHNYLYCSIFDPVTSCLRDMRFHAVLVDSTALAVLRMRPRGFYRAYRENWSFLSSWDSAKFVFPQDDYHDTHLLDATFDEWGVDKIFTVMNDRHDQFYPRSSKKATVETVLTGYVDDYSIVGVERFARAFYERDIDIGQRVTMYPPIGGRYAQLKGRLAIAVASRASERGFKVNVSTKADERITGDDWFAFLGRCRFVTGAEGGVSIWDPDGSIRDRTVRFIEENPHASFEAIEEACFPSLDGKHTFSAVSPRLFEAALLGCSQILLKGDYLDELKPFAHYVPVSHDLSDVDDAVDQMRDLDAAKKRADACYQTLIATPKYRYSTLVCHVLDDVETVVRRRHVTGMADVDFDRMKSLHQAEIQSVLPADGPYPSRVMNLLYKYGRRAAPRRLRHAVLRWLEFR